MGDETISIFTDEAEDIILALDTLYVPQNKGGRVQFIKAYPDVAKSIYGDALYRLDTEGRGDRSTLDTIEFQAETRRILFLDIIAHIKEHGIEDLSIIDHNALFLKQSDALRIAFNGDAAAQINAHLDALPPVSNEEETEELETEEHDEEIEDTEEVEPSETLNISKAIKDSTDIGKDILSDLQMVAEDYTPLVKKTLGAVADKIQDAAKEHLKEKPKKRKKSVSPPLSKKTKSKAKKQSTPEVFLKPSEPETKKSPQSWQEFVAKSQSIPAKEMDKDSKPIRGAIDIEYDTNDYSYLYARDGFDIPKEPPKKPAKKTKKTAKKPSGNVNPNTIADYTWGAPIKGDGESAEDVQSGLKKSGLGETFKARPQAHNASDDKSS